MTEQTNTAPLAAAESTTTEHQAEGPKLNGNEEQGALFEDDPRSAAADDETFFASFDEQLPSDMLAAKTLSGDLRDLMIDEIKSALVIAGTHWDKVNEFEQRRVFDRFKQFSRLMSINAIRLVRAQGVHPIAVNVASFKVDGEKGIVCQFSATRNEANLLAMDHMIGGNALLLGIDLDDYLGERKEPEPSVVGDLKMPREPAPVDTKAADAAATGADTTTGELPAEHPQQAAVVDPEHAPDTGDEPAQDAAIEEAAHRQRMADAEAAAV